MELSALSQRQYLYEEKKSRDSRTFYLDRKYAIYIIKILNFWGVAQEVEHPDFVGRADNSERYKRVFDSKNTLFLEKWGCSSGGRATAF